MRTTCADSRSTTSICARVLVRPSGEVDGRRTRLDIGQTDDPSLGLRDDLLGDDEDVIGLRREARVDQRQAPPGLGGEAAEVVARLTSGSSGRGTARSRPFTPRRARRGRAQHAMSSRRRTGSRRSRSSGRVQVEAEDGVADDLHRRAGSLGRPQVCLEAVAAEDRLDDVRRAQEERVRAAARVRRRDGHHGPPAAAARAASAANTSSSSASAETCGRSAGRTSTLLAPAACAAATPMPDALVEALVGLSMDRHRQRQDARHRREDGVWTDEVDVAASLQPARTVRVSTRRAEHQLLALLGIERLAQARLAAGDRPHRQHDMERLEGGRRVRT